MRRNICHQCRYQHRSAHIAPADDVASSRFEVSETCHIRDVLARWLVSCQFHSGSEAIIQRLIFTVSVVVISIVRIPILMAMSPTDITCTSQPTTLRAQTNTSLGTEYGVVTWSVVEVSISIFSACFPVMRPLLRRFLHRHMTVEEPHSMQITCLAASSNGKTSPEQPADTHTSAQPWQQQPPCHTNSRNGKPTPPQRVNSDESIMSIKQWRDPENMHPGDLWHVCNSSHGTTKAFKTGGANVPATTTTVREFGYGLWPAD